MSHATTRRPFENAVDGRGLTAIGTSDEKAEFLKEMTLLGLRLLSPKIL